MDDQIIDIESKHSEVIEEEKSIFDSVIIDGENLYDEEITIEHANNDFQLPENIEGVNDFNLYEFVEDMKNFEKKYDLLKQDFSIEVFESEDGNSQVWQVTSEMGIFHFLNYQDLKECFEKTPERFLSKKRLNRLKYKSIKIKNIDGLIKNKSNKIINKKIKGFKKSIDSTL